ncbi:ATP-dependent Clp protease proteolytic subunit [Candidatus Giovannonibacteria bacterium]|nr:ATP-dependent Clp protease proteolytic subunit [Candidatus Giovannonibacteria bacterium]
MVKVRQKKRSIFLIGKITKASARIVKKALEKLDAASSEEILFFINSTGGDAKASVEIHHAIHNAKSYVKTIGFGNLYSGGLMVLQGGDERFAVPRCRLKFHQICMEFNGKYLLNAKVMNALAYRAFRADAMAVYILTSRSRSVEEILKLFDEDAAISSHKARRLKVIDGIWRKPVHCPR